MGVKEEMIRDATDGADTWIDAYMKCGSSPLEAVREIQRYIKRTEGKIESDEEVLSMISTSIATLAMLGRHVVVTRMLERGIVQEEELYLNAEGEKDVAE